VPKKLVLIVVDGMTPEAFEHAVSSGRAPALAHLAAHGEYRRATSVFPSLTPVCLSSIATGAGPDVHHIPSLSWWNRQEKRLVEYGSSFAALRRAGLSQAVLDTIVNMNERHLARDATTVYEALEDAGFVAAAINITCYRGRHRYVTNLPGVRRAVHGPSRFFFYNLYESDRAGARFSGRGRKVGAVDAYAAAAGRWLVTRDGFDFLVYYLSDYDFASHAHGPAGAMDVALERVDASVGALLEAAGGPDEFLDRYAVILLSDHGQTAVERVARLEPRFADLKGQVVVTASNRAGQVYLLPGAKVDAAQLARRLDGEPAVEVTLRVEDGVAIARRGGEDFPVDELEHPDAAVRVRAALANPNAGEVLVSVAEGWELVDLGGRHHSGGGSHGSLVAGDSLVPLLTIGVDGLAGSVAGRAADARPVDPAPPARPARITEVVPAVLKHFDVR
jgi:Type I phosphodiesterase / nucleotide pyrophosphatase